MVIAQNSPITLTSGLGTLRSTSTPASTRRQRQSASVTEPRSSRAAPAMAWQLCEHVLDWLDPTEDDVVGDL